MTDKATHGGRRPNAGRKPGKATETVSFRILPEWRERIKKVVRAEIKRLKTKKPPG